MRNSSEATQGILDGMRWLGLDADEGPVYQTQRMARYHEVIQQMLQAGTAYYCYASKAELDTLREQQLQQGEKPRYDHRWRPEAGKTLPTPPHNTPAVVRFKNPLHGNVSWHDLVKGEISIANTELDDMIIARSDGTPTYNFCVVVDDHDMAISHVIRGDDHINNTPRQINLFRALNAPVPEYAHLSMIFGDDGQKLSKRHGAVNVMEYQAQGYLPQALLNYLARLGFSHHDDEIFTPESLCTWFDWQHITASSARFDRHKLDWYNAHYLKNTAAHDLLVLVTKQLEQQGIATVAIEQEQLLKLITLYKARVHTLYELAQAIIYVYQRPPIPSLDSSIHTVLMELYHELNAHLWTTESIGQVLKKTVQKFGLKFPELAMPLRLIITGSTQSPSIDEVLCLLDKSEALARINLAMTHSSSISH